MNILRDVFKTQSNIYDEALTGRKPLTIFAKKLYGTYSAGFKIRLWYIQSCEWCALLKAKLESKMGSFFICYLAVLFLTLRHYLGDSLTDPISDPKVTGTVIKSFAPLFCLKTQYALTEKLPVLV